MNDDEQSNHSGNRPFGEILAARVTRREWLAGGLAAGFAALLPSAGRADREAAGASGSGSPLIDFRPVPVARGGGPWPAISEDYRFEVLLPWGEPLVPGGPAFQWPPNARDQARQIGIGHDGMSFFPIDGAQDSGHGLLAINHEFGVNRWVLGRARPRSLEDVRVSQFAHGVSVVEIGRGADGRWRRLDSGLSRRIHANTAVVFGGPGANHPLLQTPAGNAPRGTLNNCAGGPTPWGTYLSCEENFNGYFGALSNRRSWAPDEAQRRYGLSADGFGFAWHRFDRRFDISHPAYRNEENRFGWVVEIDPFDVAASPVKRTALGRFKHENAATVTGRGGRAVVYMGDDQHFEYIYRFVSIADWRDMRDQGRSPLDQGRLYVARFNEDGTGDWLELTVDNPVLAARFGDQAEVLTFARLAADSLGATPMDRPEWTTVAPDGSVYCSLTNNMHRTRARAANPQAPNPDGHILCWRDSDEHTGAAFRWEVFLLASDTHGTEDAFSDPDGLWADPDGRLFIETDGRQRDGLNNQLLVADTRTGELRRLFTGVADAEVTGLAMTPDRRTLFVNIQHPGNGNPARTNFPAPPDGVTRPRDATVAITRKDGGIVGS